MVVLIGSFAFTFVATVALEKHRFFQEAKSDEFRWIQNEILKEIENVREIKLRTEEIYDDDKQNYPTTTRNPMRRRGAYRWLSSIMIGLMIIISTLIVIEIIQFALRLIN